LRPASVEGRFDALHAGGLTELVGREKELELLLRRWSKAKTGEGQVVLLSGEAGIGKSRLTAALLEAVAPELHTRLRNFCSPQHTDSALYPTIGQIERAAGFTREDNLQAKLDKLDALLARTSTSAQDAALLAEMLSLPHDGRYPTLELTSPERRRETLEALVLQVTTMARQKPLLMIFEDAHWADPTSLELYGRIIDSIPVLRAFLIVTYRPEFDAPWIGRPDLPLSHSIGSAPAKSLPSSPASPGISRFQQTSGRTSSSALTVSRSLWRRSRRRSWKREAKARRSTLLRLCPSRA
jgi:AAA ATPase-like protein